MSPELLRKAAAEMRARAEKATPGPWGWGGAGVGTDYRDGHREYPVAVTDFTREFGLTREWMDRNCGNGQHIASWHPAVALAVADWLDETADQLPLLGPLFEKSRQVARAHAAARAYLGANP